MPVYNEPDKTKWTKDKRHWYFRCSFVDINGNKKRYKSKMYHTQDAAKDAESEFLIKTRNHDTKKKDILFEEVFNEWLFYTKRKVKSSTYYDKKIIATKYILDSFKNKNIYKIKESDINLWLDNIEKYHFTIKYTNKIVRFFREIMTYAHKTYNTDMKIINLLHSIKDENPIQEEKLINYWTYNEWQTYIQYIDNELYFLLFNFLYFTGCRIGEVLALNWRDIDLKNKQVSINKTLNSKTGTGTYIITSPKTTNSVRKIDLTDKLVELLQKHYNNEHKIIGFKKDMFVFGNIRPLSETTIRRKFLDYLEIVKHENKNFKSITLHGFRHSHVSLLVYLGCDFRDIAERLGDTITMVQNTYYHMYPETKSKTIELLNKLK